MNKQALKFLSKMEIFSTLPADELENIVHRISVEHYPKGDTLAVQGETRVENIFIITKGQLSLYLEEQGQRTLTGHHKKGEVFGGITILLNGGISLRTVIVDEDTTFYVISKKIFLELCAGYKAFYEYFLENFSKNMFDESLASIVETGQAQHFLSGVVPFTFLPEEDIEKTAGELAMVRYPRDTVLFVQERSRVGYLYILQKGSAERYFDEDNNKTMDEMLSEGDIFGGISMLVNDGIAVRTLRVHEDSHFYLLAKQSFLDICSNHEVFSEYFTNTFGKRMLDKSYASVIAKTLQSKEDTLQFFSRPVGNIYTKNPVSCKTTSSIREAAETMSRLKISSLFINTPKGDCSGIVTERDLAGKVIAAGYDITRPISDIMPSPVRMISEQALIFEALMIMMQEDIRQLAVTDTNEKVVGTLSNRDLLTAQGQSPLFLLREIAAAESMDQIIDRHNQLPGMVRSLITSGAKADNVTRFVTSVSDAILDKLMGFTLDAMGAPPTRFVFMIMGSEGRKEQTLKTDQDNAIVYEDVPSNSETEVRDYFLKFAEKACSLLNQAGYDFCTGDVMAKNPKWCQSLSTWKEYFSGWIHAAEPKDLLNASVFFDFQNGYGDAELIESLRRHLFDSLEGWSGFFRHLTENTLHFKPPLGFFRNFLVESKGEHRNAFDIKSAMTPIVDFARIYALKNKIKETNTLERLNHLRLKKALSGEEYKELEKSYSFLLQLRFVRQITASVDEKAKPDNYINPKKLTRIEQKMLKEIFKRIGNFQAKLNFEFIGTA